MKLLTREEFGKSDCTELPKVRRSYGCTYIIDNRSTRYFQNYAYNYAKENDIYISLKLNMKSITMYRGISYNKQDKKNIKLFDFDGLESAINEYVKINNRIKKQSYELKTIKEKRKKIVESDFSGYDINTIHGNNGYRFYLIKKNDGIITEVELSFYNISTEYNITEISKSIQNQNNTTQAYMKGLLNKLK